jgi:hypothetical protein
MVYQRTAMTNMRNDDSSNKILNVRHKTSASIVRQAISILLDCFNGFVIDECSHVDVHTNGNDRICQRSRVVHGNVFLVCITIERTCFIEHVDRLLVNRSKLNYVACRHVSHFCSSYRARMNVTGLLFDVFIVAL